ncbi:MAG TPA: hypothetical protein ENN69_05790, partial [Spirochaetia bacterium]|nr:hypothetical protein [Spirochaetia bacterium]
NNWFGEALLKGAIARCRTYQYELFVVDGGTLENTYEWEYQRNKLYTMIEKDSIDALLVANVFGIVSQTAAYQFLARYSGIPVVTLCEKFPGIPAVRIDNARGFRDLVRHLVEVCGAKSFAAITGPANNFDSNERLKVMREVLGHYNLTLDPEAVICADFSDQGAKLGIEVLLDERRRKFDTLVCFNDQMAVRAMDELIRRGFDIPNDIKVTGFDNTYDSLYANPPLTTVHNPVEELSMTAVDVLRDLLHGKAAEELTVLHTRFVPRLSCGEAYVNITAPRFSPSVLDESAVAPTLTGFPEAALGWAEKVLLQSTVEIGERQKNWFREVWKTAAHKLLSEAGPQLHQFFVKTVFADRKNEWSAELWVAVADELYLYTLQLSAEDRERLLPTVLCLHNTVRMYRNSYFVNSLLQLHSLQRLLFIMGETLASLFDLDKVGEVLEQYAVQLGIPTCFVVGFTDASRTRARLIVCVEEGRNRDVTRFRDFPSRALLPKPLLDKYPSLTMNSLHVREEVFGYFFINTGDHPGILYESLRHQLSTAIKGTQLVSTVNRYSAGLEQMVQERTEELRTVNQELTNQIERREQAEKELLKQKNLESLSLLAGGIAHDFNNILTVLSGNLSLLKETDADAAYRRNRYELMRKAVANAKALTYQLLTFAKGGMPVKKTMLIEPLIEETAKFILHGSRIKPEFDFSGETLSVDMDHHQISQVMNNVILNAVQAMPNGGSLVFRVRHEQTPE